MQRFYAVLTTHGRKKEALSAPFPGFQGPLFGVQEYKIYKVTSPFSVMTQQ